MIGVKTHPATVCFLLVASSYLIRCLTGFEINLNETREPDERSSISAFQKIDLHAVVQSHGASDNLNEIFLRGVNFGCLGASRLTLNINSPKRNTSGSSTHSNLIVKIDHPDSSPIASFKLFDQLEANVLNSTVKVQSGVHDVYISMKGLGSNVGRLNSIKFYTTKPNPDLWYYMFSQRGGLALGVASNFEGSLKLGSFANGNHQKFRFEEMIPDFYKITVKQSQLVLEVKDFGRGNYNPIVSSYYRSLDNQLWSLYPDTLGSVNIRVRHSTHCVDGNGGTENVDVIAYYCNGASHQKIYLVPVC